MYLHLRGGKKCRWLSLAKCADLLLKVLEQNNATKVPRLLYQDVLIMAHNEGACCASTTEHRGPTHTHTVQATWLSSLKIIRHHYEFPCFLLPPLVHFIHVLELWEWLMQLTCSHHEFSLCYYICTLWEHGRHDYGDGINTRACAHAHTNGDAVIIVALSLVQFKVWLKEKFDN